jgi:hypothetical protein
MLALAGMTKNCSSAGQYRKAFSTQFLRKLLLDAVDQLQAFGFHVGGAAFVVLEVSQGGFGVSLGTV